MIDCGVLKQTTEIVQVNGGIWVAGKRGDFGRVAGQALWRYPIEAARRNVGIVNETMRSTQMTPQRAIQDVLVGVFEVSM